MSSSPAYNNVLLKSPVQAQPAAAPRRDSQDDELSANFHQAFTDARANAREQDERAESPADKSAQAGNRTSHNTAGKKPSEAADRKEQATSRDDFPQDKNNDYARGEQQTAAATEKNVAAKTDDQDADKTDTSVAPLSDTAILQPAVTPVVTIGSFTMPLTITPASLPDEVIDITAGTETLPLPGVLDGVVVAEATTLSQATDALIQVTDTANQASDNDVLKAGKVTPELFSGLAVSDVDADVQTRVDAALTVPATPVGNLENPVQQATVAAVAPLKPGSPQLAAPLTQVLSETEEPIAITGSTGFEKTPVKPAVVLDQAETVNIDKDGTPTQSPLMDSKTAFGKTLQNLVRSDASPGDERASAPMGQGTASTVNNVLHGLDSLARFSDTSAPATRSFVAQTAIPVPLGQPNWSQAVGEKVLWLAAQNVSAAEIHLNPENLGPMQVKVSVNQEQASVSFTSHHAVVREVLDQNLNRLRDLFNEQGMSLNVDVSDKSFSRHQDDAEPQKGQAGTHHLAAEEDPVVAVSSIVQQRLVDHYA